MAKAKVRGLEKDPKTVMHCFRRLLVATAAAAVPLGIGKRNAR